MAVIEYLSAKNKCLFETDMCAVCGKVCMTDGQRVSFCTILLKFGKDMLFEKNRVLKSRNLIAKK